MATNRYLIDYLPPFMRDFHEIKNIMSSEQEEIDMLWKSSEDVLREQFITTASETGIKHWESALNIKPKATETLEERRFAILTKMNQELPYTLTKLKEKLTTICGAGNFEVDIQADKYHVEVKLGLANQNNYQQVVDLLTNMIPANMTQHVQIMFNTNSVWSNSTHSQLSKYTHKRLRNEVVINGE